MNEAAHYRIKAAEFHAKAQTETNPKHKAQFESLAVSYIRLSEQAERNSQNNVVYESPGWMMANAPSPGKNND
ncbi:MAG TPA: hypothetical protein VM867_01885 [Xanthobacteraceae bacterium]|nr:hypothetical protein [Xanthobacteraceae bacterium]